MVDRGEWGYSKTTLIYFDLAGITWEIGFRIAGFGLRGGVLAGGVWHGDAAGRFGGCCARGRARSEGGRTLGMDKFPVCG